MSEEYEGERGMVPAGDTSDLDVWNPSGAGGILYSSMPLGEDRASRIAVYNAVSGDCETVKDSVNKEILIEHVIVHHVILTDPTTGEITDHRRMVFIGPEGKDGSRSKVAAISNGTEMSMRKIIATVGNPPYDPPLRAKARNVQTRRGFSAIVLELLG